MHVPRLQRIEVDSLVALEISLILVVDNGTYISIYICTYVHTYIICGIYYGSTYGGLVTHFIHK